MGKANKMGTKTEDWQRKQTYLRVLYGSSVAPVDFYQSIGLSSFGEGFSICAIQTANARRNRFKRYAGVLEMLDGSFGRKDAYVYPASYFHSYGKEKLLHSLSCLYIDLDYVDASSLVELCQNDFYGKRPTYLVNSGNGVHLVYVLQNELPTYNWAKKPLKEIHHRLLQFFRNRNFHADMGTGISHPYRIVGSLTKLGMICSAYRVGSPVTIEALASSVGVRWARPEHQTVKRHSMRWNGSVKRGFYDFCVRSIAEKTKEGHRETSIFALACVGYKCGLSADAIREDAYALADQLRLPRSEVDHVLDTCDPEKAKLVPSRKLEEWFGWNFERRTKRNGRTRIEHLARLAKAKVQESQRKVEGYLREHRSASIAEVARALEMSRNTVARHIGIVRAKLAKMASEVRDILTMPTEEKVASMASLQAFSAPAQFIAYILALWAELCSGRWQNGEVAFALRYFLSLFSRYVST